MREFSINSKYLENVRSAVVKFPEYMDKTCNIIINEKFNIQLPVIIASSFSSSIIKTITNDPTAEEFRFSLQTDSQDSLEKIKSVMCRQEVVSIDNEDDISTFAEFGLAIENDDFINPLKERLTKDLSETNENNVMQIIKSKKTFHIEDIEREVLFIAENFETMSTREDFIEFSCKASNSNIVESIISSEKLNMKHEDTLLTFLLTINKSKTIENISLELFNHLFIEYCSSEKCEEFISFVCEVVHQQKIKSLVSFIGRRFTQPNIPMKPNFICGRHKKDYTVIDKEDPLNGILRREYNNGNLVLESPSLNNYNHYGLYNLVNANDDAFLHINSEPISFVKASLRKGKTFVVKSYMIRGNYNKENVFSIQNWRLEGQKASDGKWVILDSHENDMIPYLQVRAFDVSCEEELKAIKLIQTGKNSSNGDSLCINAFDIFGILF